MESEHPIISYIREQHFSGQWLPNDDDFTGQTYAVWHNEYKYYLFRISPRNNSVRIQLQNTQSPTDEWAKAIFSDIIEYARRKLDCWVWDYTSEHNMSIYILPPGTLGDGCYVRGEGQVRWNYKKWCEEFV